MAFNLNSQSPISSKIRQQMYLKHLRQVERISNRQADALKKQLKEYRSITQIHRNNKKIANKVRNQGSIRDIKQKNQKIKQKIQSIDSDFSIRRSINNSAISRTMSAAPKFHQISTQLQLTTPLDTSVTATTTPISSPFSIPVIRHNRSLNPNPQHSLHSRYRKKQQIQIQHQNSKIFKAIQNQKSKLMWLLGRDHSNYDMNININMGRNNNRSDTIRSSYKPNIEKQKQDAEKVEKFRERLQKMQKSEKLDRINWNLRIQ